MVRSDSPSAVSLVRIARGLSAVLAVAGLTGLVLMQSGGRGSLDRGSRA